MDISSMSLAEIKQLINRNTEFSADLPEIMRAMSADARVGVRNLCRVLEKRRQRAQNEKSRLEALFLHEGLLRDRNIEIIAGVDEAGRGPLAGPVIAAAVILPFKACIYGLNDSKKLSAKKRKTLAAQIKKVSLAWAVGIGTVNEIKEINIYNASMLAMRRAVSGLDIKPDHVLVDGFAVPDLGISQTAIVGGDGKSASIAAASILAKETRDDLMSMCHYMYPEYGFDRHKGYGTIEHLQALKRYGPCPIHRQGFGPVKALNAGGCI